ncbi:MAG: LamG domain-containing protein, partial [Solirubrobacteraceae bacterium]
TLNGGQVVSTQPQAAPSTYSEELWFNTTSTSGGVLATYADASGGLDRVVYMTSSGQLDFGVQSPTTSTIQSPRSYNDGQWHFVVATQGSDGMRLYVDGQLVASGSTATAASYLANWQLGGYLSAGWPNGPTSAFSGSMSDAAVFLSELTAAQVEAEYSAGGSVTRTTPPPPPPPPTATSSLTPTTTVPSNEFSTLSRKLEVGGKVTLQLESSDAGRFDARVTFSETLTVESGRGQHRHKVVVHRTLTYAAASDAADGPGTTSLTLSPTRAALALLRARHKLHVTIVVTFIPTGGSSRQMSEPATITAPTRQPLRQG